jgi:hypothetical protein
MHDIVTHFKVETAGGSIWSARFNENDAREANLEIDQFNSLGGIPRSQAIHLVNSWTRASRNHTGEFTYTV